MSILSKFSKPVNEFHFIIGEDGLVYTYLVAGSMKARGFYVSQDVEETTELRKLLMGDPEAQISIFIDSIDQTYTQRSIPVIGLFGTHRLAQSRLEKDHPKQQLKSALPVGRLTKGRRDYMYVFAAASHEGIVGNWIKFLIPFPNVIKGIYLLPIELYAVIEAIKNSEAYKNETLGEEKKGTITKTKDLSKWELILINGKSGGFRQVAYCNGIVIFTRLLNSSGTVDDDVIAGNIEQEIVSSIEYLRRIATTDVSSVDLYLIIPDSITVHLRKNRFGVNNIFTYSPYQLSLKIKNGDYLSKPKDRFADPSILSILAANKKRISMMHIAETLKVINVVHLLNIIIFLSYAFMPFITLFIIWQLFAVFSGALSLYEVKAQLANLDFQLNNRKQLKLKSEERYGKNTNISMIKEKTYIFTDIEPILISPLQEIYKLAAVAPTWVRIKNIKWSYNVFRQQNNNNSTNPQAGGLNPLTTPAVPGAANPTQLNNMKLTYTYSGQFTITFENSSGNYAELVDKYTEYSRKVLASFSDKSVKISSLPQNFSFSEEQKSIFLTININHPKLENKEENLKKGA